MQDSFVGPFLVTKLHGKNAVEVILTGEFVRKHPVFPVSLLKLYHTTDKDKYRSGLQTPPEVPTMDTGEEKKFLKILKQKRIEQDNKDVTLYLVRYKLKGQTMMNGYLQKRCQMQKLHSEHSGPATEVMPD